jgi:DNA-binding MarR family transcriptional regulator
MVLGGLESRQLIVRRAHPEHGRIILFSLTKEGTNHSFRFWCG